MSKANNATIGFIGGGNMASSLIGGLLQGGQAAEQIYVAEPNTAQQQTLAENFGIQLAAHASQIIQHCDCIVLAVKPQIMQAVINDFRDSLAAHKPLFISIAAGIQEHTLARWLGNDHAIVRCMPNTPALIQLGATALFANTQTSDQQKALAESILATAGITLWLEQESEMDAVTAISGSGPAYFFLVIEALQAAGEKLGLSPEQSRLLSIQTAVGASRMAQADSEPASVLRQRVTSKGGTTERAIATFLDGDLPALFQAATTAAYTRSQELALELDTD